MRAAEPVRRLTYFLASLLPGWAVIALVTDGLVVRAGPLRLSSTEPVRPLLVAAAATAVYLWRSTAAERRADGKWLGHLLETTARVSVPVVVVLGAVVGIAYGTFAAAGSDAYGYVSQAALWLRGDLRVEQPIVGDVSWPDAAWTFTPLGYRPISADVTIVPTYPSGLPMIMAVFQRILGADGPFFVVPVMAAIALYATYLLGRVATGSRTTGALAALLLLASPVFMAHAMVPMTDVPVAACWASVCALALRRPPRPLLAGAIAGLSLLIRPNLILLCAAPVCAWVIPAAMSDKIGRDLAMRRVLAFAAGVAPAILTVATINYFVYGSPFESGYGGLGDVYGMTSVVENTRNYAIWLLQTQSVLVLLAIVPLFVPAALRPATAGVSPRACLFAMPALTLLSYVFYAAFDNWTYLRFMLPAYPALFVLMAAGVAAACARLADALRPAAAVALVAACVSLSVQFAKNQFIFDWQQHESRYVRAAERAAELTPRDAVLFSSQHSGSLRYYTNRVTLRYDLLSPRHLETALDQLRGKGRASFLVIDDWEAKDFRSRFDGAPPVRRLESAPLARISGPPDVLIYALTDREE